jgi:hypothetical protein
MEKVKIQGLATPEAMVDSIARPTLSKVGNRTRAERR